MLNKSIAYRLSVYVSLAVIGVFLAFILVSYIYNQKALKENVTNKAISETSRVIMQIEKLLISSREITSNISDQILYYDKNGDSELFVRKIMEKYPFFNAIHIVLDTIYPNQQYFDYFALRENDSVTFEKGKQYQVACEGEEIVLEELRNMSSPGWSIPFKCERNGKVVVSFHIPIEVNSDINQKIRVGEVTSELSLIDLSDSINTINIGKRGYAFLVAPNGAYITHPNKDWILNRNIFTIPEKIYNKSGIRPIDLMGTSESSFVIVYSDFLKFEKTWIYYSTIQESGWKLIYAQPYNELFEPLYKVLLRLLFISVLGILFIYLLVTYITNKQIEPLSDATNRLKKFSNLSGKKDIQTLNEVEQVSLSLNYLKKWYEEYNANLSAEKQQRFQRMQDLEQASEIQLSLIKAEFPAYPERTDIELGAIYKPAKIVSGDLYDFFFIDEENLLLTMGDVSGKGIPAAIFMSVAQTIIKGNSTFKKAKTIVNKANKELYTNNQHQFFLTLFLGVFNVKTGVLNYCNAAHTSSFILKDNGEISELKKSNGLPLGLYPDKEYSDSKIKIESGDTIILYTDGVIDANNKQQNRFGIDRLKKKLLQLTQKSPDTILLEIEKEIEKFKGESVQNDDISILILRYTP